MRHLKIMIGTALVLAIWVARSEAANGCGALPCSPPSEAVLSWMTVLPGLFNVDDMDGSPDQADCQRLCNKWVEGCKDYAELSKKCLDRTSEALFKKFFIDGACKTLNDGSSVKMCQAEPAAVLKLLGDEFKRQSEQARMCCDDELPNCLQKCLTGEDPTTVPDSCDFGDFGDP